MKTTPTHPSRIRRAAGFTLIEMIGVIAIMGILAATIAPNALRMLDREAVRAEAATLRALGEQAKLCLRDTGTQLNDINWNAALALYATLSANDLLNNRRQMPRVYVPDPAGADLRGMFITSMRNGLALPPVGTMTANFNTIWSTPEGTVPGGTGWGSWNLTNVEFLVIERVNYQSMPELQFSLRNESGGPVNFQVFTANGTALLGPTKVGPLPANSTITAWGRSNQRLTLYNAVGAINYNYVVGTDGKSFRFDGTNWIPQ